MSRPLAGISCLKEFEPAAQRHLPKPLFEYVSGGCETNASIASNEAAFQRYGFWPRVLIDVSKRSPAAQLFGTDYDAPFGIAPMGLAALIAYRGDLVMAAAAAKSGIPMIMSGASLIPLEEVARAAPGTWFQAYVPGEIARIDGLIERAAKAGFKTLVMTADAAAVGNRKASMRTGFNTPMRPTLGLAWQGVSHPHWLLGTFARTIVKHGMPHFENTYVGRRGEPILSRTVMGGFGQRDTLSWAHLERVRKNWPGKLVVKGILRAEDAKMAVDLGADGVIVSNHGGRQLDGAAPALLALREVAGAVGHQTTVMMDGGIRRGADLIKALALGAKFVFVGRPFLYAAAIGGEAGVRKAADILKAEIMTNMALLGVNAIGEITPDLVREI